MKEIPALSRGERVARDGVFASRSGTGEGVCQRHRGKAIRRHL